MQEIEDLEKKMGTENIAESAMSEERGLMDRSEIVMERLEVQQLSEALVSASMEIVSAQGMMRQAEEIVEETRHRLDSLLIRLKEAERESDR
ncbi:MAG: hypothetical protein V3V98_02610 [Thermoplasmata archaeon]